MVVRQLTAYAALSAQNCAELWRYPSKVDLEQFHSNRFIVVLRCFDGVFQCSSVNVFSLKKKRTLAASLKNMKNVITGDQISHFPTEKHLAKYMTWCLSVRQYGRRNRQLLAG